MFPVSKLVFVLKKRFPKAYNQDNHLSLFKRALPELYQIHASPKQKANIRRKHS
jgi:hypothetical protein